MQTARRLYVYLISGVTLALLVGGLHLLVQLALESVGLTAGPDLIAGEPDVSQQVSSALALVAVGAPVWFIHWGWTERSLRPGLANAEDERTSVLRAVYLTAVLFILLGLVGSGAFTVIQTGAVLAGGGDLSDVGAPGSLADGLASLLVAGAAWAYHAAVRHRDLAVAPVSGGAAWLPRAYLYGAAFVGVSLLLTGLSELLGLAVSSVFETGGALLDPSGADPRLANGVALTLTAAAVWMGHFGYAQRLVGSVGWRGAAERPSRLRLGYFVFVMALALASAVFEVITAMSAALSSALAVAPEGAALAPSVIQPLLLTLLFAAAWILHVRWMAADASALDDPARTSHVWRLERYVPALVGLAIMAAGAAGLMGLIVRALASGTQLDADSDVLLAELGRYLPVAIIGAAVWAAAWIQIVRRTEADPEQEGASTVRRASLVLVITVTVVAGVVALGLVLAGLFQTLLGGELSSADFAALGLPIGILLTATLLGTYHGQLVRQDVLRDAAAGPDPAAQDAAVMPDVESEPSSEAAWEGEGGAVLPPGIILTLRGPDGTDSEAALQAARDALPEGYRLERD